MLRAGSTVLAFLQSAVVLQVTDVAQNNSPYDELDCRRCLFRAPVSTSRFPGAIWQVSLGRLCYIIRPSLVLFLAITRTNLSLNGGGDVYIGLHWPLLALSPRVYPNVISSGLYYAARLPFVEYVCKLICYSYAASDREISCRTTVIILSTANCATGTIW